MGSTEVLLWAQQPQDTSRGPVREHLCHPPSFQTTGHREGPGLRKRGQRGNRDHCGSYALGSLSGATEKPYLVEEAISYNELDYVSVSSALQRVCCEGPALRQRGRSLPQP